FMEETRKLFAGRDEFGRIAGIVEIERALAMHNHFVPASVAEDTEFVIEVELEPAAGLRLEVDVVVQSGLDGEGLEQSRHTTDALIIQIGHSVRTIKANSRAGAESKAVADEQQTR